MQFLGYSYNLRLSLEKPGSAVLGADEQNEVTTLQSIMSAAHQNYLIFLRRVYIRTWKPQYNNVCHGHLHI